MSNTQVRYTHCRQHVAAVKSWVAKQAASVQVQHFRKWLWYTSCLQLSTEYYLPVEENYSKSVKWATARSIVHVVKIRLATPDRMHDKKGRTDHYTRQGTKGVVKCCSLKAQHTDTLFSTIKIDFRKRPYLILHIFSDIFGPLQEVT